MRLAIASVLSGVVLFWLGWACGVRIVRDSEPIVWREGDDGTEGMFV